MWILMHKYSSCDLNTPNCSYLDYLSQVNVWQSNLCNYVGRILLDCYGQFHMPITKIKSFDNWAMKLANYQD